MEKIHTRCRSKQRKPSVVLLKPGVIQSVGCRERVLIRTRAARSLRPTTTRTSQLCNRPFPLADRLVLGLLVALARTASAFVDKSSLADALDEWCTNAVDAEAAHGHVSAWDVSAVTDMRYLVKDALCQSTFNEDINAWDVSQVTSMQVRPLPL